MWGNSRSLGFGFDQEPGATPDANSFSSANLIAELAVLHRPQPWWPATSLLSFPPRLQQCLTLLPEGVDLERISLIDACLHLPEQALEFKAGQPLVTSSPATWNLQGLRQLLKAWPRVADPAGGAACAVAARSDTACNSRRRRPFIDAFEGCRRVNREQIHDQTLPHAAMLTLLQCSACHVALSYPYTMERAGGPGPQLRSSATSTA